MKYGRAYLLLIVLFLGCSDRANPINAANVIYGRIWDKDTGTPIHQAGVLVKSPQDLSFFKFDSTNAYGDYAFENLDPGTYNLTVEAVGYEDAVGQVLHEAGRSLRDFALTPDTTQAKHARPKAPH